MAGTLQRQGKRHAPVCQLAALKFGGNCFFELGEADWPHGADQVQELLQPLMHPSELDFWQILACFAHI